VKKRKARMAPDSNTLELYFKDWPLVGLIVLFIAVLIAFFKGAVDYPIGWLLLLVLIYVRIQHIRKNLSKPPDQEKP